MILIVGLGNPGEKYKRTRHNLGFLVLDTFKKEQKFSSWQNKTKLQAKISEEKITGKKIILAKPQTYMNNSGKSVLLLTKRYNLNAKNLMVVHDDLDIPLGEIKISHGRGSAGHKGVQSIIEELGTKDFTRFRIGIKPMNNKQQTINNKQRTTNNIKVEKFVLENFTNQEQGILKQVIKKTCQILEITIKKGVEKAMSEYNSPR